MCTCPPPGSPRPATWRWRCAPCCRWSGGIRWRIWPRRRSGRSAPASPRLCLATGSLWGKPMWGAWWVWDARLTSVLVLFFLYLGHIALVRAFDDPQRGYRCRRDPGAGRRGQPADHQVQRRLVEHAAPAGHHHADRRADDVCRHAVAAAVRALGYTLVFAAIVVARMRAAVMERRIRALLMARADEAAGMTHLPFIMAAYALGRADPGEVRGRGVPAHADARSGGWPRWITRRRAMTRKRRRLWIVLACGLGLGSATALALSAFRDNLVFFLAPSDVASKAPTPGRELPAGRAGRAGQRAAHDRRWPPRSAVPRDRRQGQRRGQLSVGILPDLFREGQGIVALGTLNADGTFRASEVLAKHDETYMPKEVVEALKKPAIGTLPPGPPPAGGDLERRRHAGARAGQALRYGMIPELGHFALALAVVIAGAQAVLPLLGRAGARHPADADRAGAGDRPVDRAGDVVRLPGLERGGRRFLGRQHRRELQQPEAADLQDHRHLGEPRGLHPAVVPDPRFLRRRGRGVRPRLADRTARAGDRRAGLHLRRASCCSR